MSSFIINADDLGLRHQINQSIEQLILAGVVTSSTIMVKRNGDAFREAIAIAKRYSHVVGFGLHLDLDDYFFFDETGHFGNHEKDIVPDYLDILANNKRAIENDIRDQIGALVDSGIEPTHAAGHHAIHQFPGLMEIIIPALREHGIEKIRFSREFYETPESLACSEAMLRRHGVRYPRALRDLGWIMEDSMRLKSDWNGTIEFIAHTELGGTENWRIAQHYFLIDKARFFREANLVSFKAV